MKELAVQDKIEAMVLNPSSNNKDVIQSYIFTSARYDFSVYEKRILYRLVEYFQAELKGKTLDKNYSINHDLSGLPLISMPISCFRPNKRDKHYVQIKTALTDLQRKIIQYENNERWESISMIAFPVILKYHHTVQFRLHPKVYDFLMDFSKGWRKFELETIMSFKSVYAMRFYELMSGQKEPLTYMIKDLKVMFQLENKYKRMDDFIKYVIEPARRELDLKSPYSFTYRLDTEKIPKQVGRPKITKITFTPVYHPEHRDALLTERDERRTLDFSKVLLPEERYFFSSLGFTEEELKSKHYDLVLDIARARRRGEWLIHDHLLSKAKEASDSKAYALHSLRNGLEKYEERVMEQQHGKSSGSTRQEEESNKERRSIRSFLSTMMGFSGETLEKTTDLIIKKGGSDYLNGLFTSCKGNMREIREKLVR